MGVALKRDVRVDTMIAQGAKPVGGVYRVVGTGRATPGGSKSEAENDASRSTIGAIVLDEAATVEDEDARGYSEVEDDNEDSDSAEEMPTDDKEAKRAKLLAVYAKARIPKPPLAEANLAVIS